MLQGPLRGRAEPPPRAAGLSKEAGGVKALRMNAGWSLELSSVSLVLPHVGQLMGRCSFSFLELHYIKVKAELHIS